MGISKQTVFVSNVSAYSSQSFLCKHLEIFFPQEWQLIAITGYSFAKVLLKVLPRFHHNQRCTRDIPFYLFIHSYVAKNAIIISNLSGVIVERLSQISRFMLQYFNFHGYFYCFLVSGSFGMVSLYPLFCNVWCR